MRGQDVTLFTYKNLIILYIPYNNIASAIVIKREALDFCGVSFPVQIISCVA